jgi:hypothetical protein
MPPPGATLQLERHVRWVGGAHAPPLTVGSHPKAGIDRPRLSPYVTNACFKCFRSILHVFHMDVAKLDRDVAYIKCFRGMLQVFQRHVASVSKACCKRLFEMFSSTCCICFTHIYRKSMFEIF